jgi:hypothetical protein
MYGNQPPEQPNVDLGAICNICGGDGGSDLDQVTKPEACVDTGMGISAKCHFLYKHVVEGAFTSGHCTMLQKTVRSLCGCGGQLQV